MSTQVLPMRFRNSGGSSASIWAVGLLVLFVAVYLLIHEDYALLVATCAAGIILALSVRSKPIAILAVCAFLFLLGDIRRIVTQLAGGGRDLDPILLIGAGSAVYLALPLLLRVKLSDAVSKLVMALMAVMALEVFNPRQGPIMVGVTGAFFWFVPLLWFWIGRRYGSDRTLYLLLYRVVVPLGVLCAVLGIAQSFIGFFPWEEAWARSLGATYFLGRGHIRPFGFATSGQEYGSILLMTSILIVAAAFSKRYAYLLLLPVTITAMGLSAMRGPIVKVMFAAAILWAVRGDKVRTWIPRLILGIVCGAAALSYVATKAGGDDTQIVPRSKRTTANLATAHIAQGLAHPLDSQKSTGGAHWALFVGGIAHGFVAPVGEGLGATTLGASKFGGESDSYSSEVDISDVFITTGFVGGLLYLFIIFMVIRRVPDFLRSGPRAVRLPVIGLLASLIGSWIAFQQYSVAPIAWFSIGCIVKSSLATKLAGEKAAKEATAPLSPA